MDPNRFNQACRYLQPQQMVEVRLITGQELKGFFLHYTKAVSYEGSLEIETNTGIMHLISSSIDRIDLAYDQLA